ncbi:MAG: queuosine precursor transporter [Clostridiaceae bacterium]|nr:queuosine precursor transporter [Clostridiaceae bacterium]
MSNELILLTSVVIFFGGTLVWMRLFGEQGLICFTVLATISANIEVMILVNAFGMEQTLGNILFASTFLVTDILSETKGKPAANKAVNAGILASISFIIISQIWLLFTPSSNDWAFESIKTIFSNTPRTMLASLLVYAICQRFDVWAYHKIWEFTEEKTGSHKALLWVRNNAATLMSQLINTVLFNFAAFGGIYSARTMVSICASGYLIFIFTSLLDTPFVYLARYMNQKHPI